MRFPWRSLRWAFLVPVLGSLLLPFSQAATVTLTPVADTTLYSGDPTNSLGGLLTLIAGTTVGVQSNRALIQFDLSASLPPEALVEAVSLSLTVTRTVALGSNSFRLHRVRPPWGEGAGAGSNTGSPAVPGEATWMARHHPDSLWAVPGAGTPEDYETTPSATQVLGAEGNYNFTGPGLVADIEEWRSRPDGNAGWILVCAEEGTIPSSRRIASREDPTAPPQLTIQYRLPDRYRVELTAVADTSLFEYRADNNLGASELAAGSIGFFTNRSRALIRFDVAGGVPAEALVTAARLRLVVTRVGGGGAEGTGTNFTLHRVLQPWGEGRGGSSGELLGTPAEPGEATWFARFYPDTPWAQPGAGAGEDFLASPSSTQFVDSFGPHLFAALADDVQFWRVHPEQNYGWILVDAAEDVPRTARRFAAREDPLNGPVLEVEYLMPPHLDGVDLGAGVIGFRFQGLALNYYSIECSRSLNPAGWNLCSPALFPLESGPLAISISLPDGAMFYRLRLEATAGKGP